MGILILKEENKGGTIARRGRENFAKFLCSFFAFLPLIKPAFYLGSLANPGKSNSLSISSKICIIFPASGISFIYMSGTPYEYLLYLFPLAYSTSTPSPWVGRS
jgi:hypothetical protein